MPRNEITSGSTKRNAPDGLQYGAIHYKQNFVRTFVKTCSEDLRTQIISLFREGLSPQSIYEVMQAELQLDPNAAPDTNIAAVRLLLRELIDPETYSRAKAKRSAYVVNSIRPRAEERKLAWMKEKGFVVWTDEQKEFFSQLLLDPSMKRNVRLNHDKIAAAMNQRFQVTTFTPKLCSDYVLRIRHAEKHKERQRKVRAERKRERKAQN